MYVVYAYIFQFFYLYHLQLWWENYYCLNTLVTDQTRSSRSSWPSCNFPTECIRILPICIIDTVTTIIKYIDLDATLTCIIHIDFLRYRYIWKVYNCTFTTKYIIFHIYIIYIVCNIYFFIIHNVYTGCTILINPHEYSRNY